MHVPAIHILFEDDDLIVVDKPVGIVVDDGAERTSEKPDLILLLSQMGRKTFPFHRLDRDTSGIVLLGKSRKFAKEITALFEEKRIRKAYLAVVSGIWPTGLNRVAEPIGERESLTTFRRLAVSLEVSEPDAASTASWIEALPKTGRKHQIRVHCASSGHAILGDTLYGAKDSGAANDTRSETSRGHALHAYSLSFRHPGNGETISLKAPPEAWRETWLKNIDHEAAWTKLFKARGSE